MKRRIAWIVVTLLTLISLSCGLFGGDGDQEQPEPTEPPAAGAEATSEPQSEPTQPPEQEQLPPATREADGMVMHHVPEGEFTMGHDESAFAPERPAHIVFLDAYWIDRYEVNNAQYRLCVDQGVCAAPKAWDDVNFNADAQPAIVDWEGARAYCEWAGGRLPTEAEWEKAARGTDERIWPWGNEFVANRANLSSDEDGYGHTAPVGSFPEDTSPYGLLDVAGNAAEWVSDWFDREYYGRSPASNPTGPASGDQRVHRGTISNAGGGPEKCRCVARYASDPSWVFGFRCVVTTEPSGEAAGAAAAGTVTETEAEATPTPAPEEVASGEQEPEATSEPAAAGAQAARPETVSSYCQGWNPP